MVRGVDAYQVLRKKADKGKAAFQIELKRRAHMLLIESACILNHPSAPGANRPPIIRFAVQNRLRKSSKTFMLRSGEVEAVEVHDLIPGCHEVMDKLLLRVGTPVNFCQGTELGI